MRRDLPIYEDDETLTAKRRGGVAVVRAVGIEGDAKDVPLVRDVVQGKVVGTGGGKDGRVDDDLVFPLWPDPEKGGDGEVCEGTC